LIDSNDRSVYNGASFTDKEITNAKTAGCMIDETTKRAVRKALKDAGFSSEIVNELVLEGKTLRDEMAKAALQGLLANPENSDGANYGTTLALVADMSYDFADAMMTRRSK
jgi:hypothetical protein